MKKLLFLLFVINITVFLSCKNTSENKNRMDEKINNLVKIENKMETIELTKADFLAKVMDYETNPSEWKYLGDKPAIVDFYASWCGPCKAVAPILEELATEYGDSIYIYKIDTEKERELAGAFGIKSIPTLLFIPMEGQPQMAQGAMPKESFKEAIDKVLLNK